MAHIWIRAEQRPFEQRVGVTPAGVRALQESGHQVTVEDSPARAIETADYAATGCSIVAADSWPDAPDDAIVFGLKELDPEGPDLRHRHIMFGHAFKGQDDAVRLLSRFKRGGGTLLDLEYLVDDAGRRIAAFGYWAGYAGAAVGLMALAAQQSGKSLGPIRVCASKNVLLSRVRRALGGETASVRPSVIVIGAKGRVGTGATDLCESLGLPVTKWDVDETRHGGPFPEILDHTLFVNCILAAPGVPVFVPASAISSDRALRVIADVSCDPGSSYNPIPIYDRSTSFDDPLVHVTDGPQPLDVMAIDNLPSLLPVESSTDYAAQLLPYLMTLSNTESGVWGRAKAVFDKHMAALA